MPPDDGGKAHTLSAVIPVEGDPDLYLVSLGLSVCVVRWSITDPDQHTVKPHVLVTVDKSDHLNDAKCDPQGRLWIGKVVSCTTSPIKSQLQKLNKIFPI